MVGKSLTQKIVIRSQEMYVDRAMSGRVIWLNCWKRVAPSMLAASYTVVSTEARAAEIIIIMNGKLTQTLKTITVMEARVGSARNSGVPRPRFRNRAGIRLSGVATSQFQAVEDTTIGTTQGRSSRTLNVLPAGILVRRSRARPRPTSQDPNTPTMVNQRVNWAAFQNAGEVRTVVKFLTPTKLPVWSR